MSFQVGASCYGSETAALSAIAAGESGKVVPAGSVVYVVDAVPLGSSSITYTLTPIDGSPAVSHVQAVTLSECGLLDWEDGLALGWGVAGAWLLTFAVLIMRKAAHQ